MAVFGTGAIGTGIVFSMVDNFSATSDKIAAKFTKLDATVTKATQRISSGLRIMKLGFAGMLTGAILLAPLIGATKTAMEFSSVMSEVGAKSQATAAQMKTMRYEALRLGEATKFSAREVGEGQTFLAMAGFKVNQIVAAMPGLLSLAAAGNVDLAFAADKASNILTAFGIKATNMNRVADVMALTVARSNVSMEQLAESMKFAAPYASMLNISFEKTSAIVGLLGNIGIQGSIAGTAIRAFGSHLAKLDNKKLSMLGLTMADIQDKAGNMKSIEVVMAKIIGSMKGLGNLQQVSILSKLFGLRGMPAIAGIQKAIGNSKMDFEGFIKMLEKSDGAAGQMAARMMNNLKGDVIILKSVWETSMIKMGETSEKMFRPVVKWLSRLVKGFGDMISTGAGKWFIRLVGYAGMLILGLSTLVVVFGALKFAVGALTIKLKDIYKAGKLFLSTPWGITLMVAAAAFVVAVKASKEFSKVLNDNAEKAKGFTGYMQRLGGVFAGISEIWKTATKDGFTMSSKLHDSLQKIGILELVVSIGTWIVRIKQFAKGIKVAFQDISKSVNNVIDKITVKIDWLTGTLDKNTSSLRDWQLYGEMAAYAVATAIGYFTAKMIIMTTVGIVKAIVSLGALIFKFFFLNAAIFKSIFRIGLLIAKIVWMSVVTIAQGAWSLGVMIAKFLWLAVVTVATAIPAIVAATAAFFTMAGSVLAASLPFLIIVGAIAAVAYGLYYLYQNWEMITGAIDRFMDKAVNYGAGLVNSIQEGIASAWQSLKDWFWSMVEDLMSPLVETMQFLGLIDDVEVQANLVGGGSVAISDSTAEQNRMRYQPVTRTDTIRTESKTVENIQLVLPDGRVLADLVNEENNIENYRQ